MATGLYARLIELRWRRRATVVPRAERRPGGDPNTEFPASITQTALWLATQIEPGNAGHHGGTARRLTGPLRHDLIERAVKEVAERHEVLRTIFAQRRGRLLQIVPARGDVDWAIERPSVSDEPATWARQRCTSLVGARFDLDRPCALRGRLLVLGDDDHVLVLCAHHLHTDVASLSMLHREIQAHYESLVHDAPTPLSADPLQYGDFAAWQQSWLESPDCLEQLAYWVRALDGAPARTKLRGELRAPSPAAPDGARRIARSLDPSVLERLRALIRDSDTTLFVALLGIFAVWVQQSTGQGDVVVAVPVPNRLRPGCEAVVGPMANRVMARVRVDEAMSFRQLLVRIGATVLDALANQEVPFERVLGAVRAARQPDVLPFSRVTMQHVRLQSNRAADISVEYFPFVLPTLASLVHFVIVESDAVSIDAHFRPDAIPESAVAEILDGMVALVTAITALPAAPDCAIHALGVARPMTAESAPSSRAGALPPKLVGAPAQTTNETRLLAVWQEAFNLPNLGTTDDFFEAGGHSLLALQIFAAIERVFGKRLPLTTIFERPTVEEMAELLDEP